MPKGVTWVHDAAAAADPAAQTVTTQERPHPAAMTTWSWRPGSSWTSARCPGSPRRSASAASPATTASTSPRAPGNSSATCAAAPPCSPCPPGRSSAQAPRRRSPIWLLTGGAPRASWTAPGSSWCCPPPPCSASPTGRRCWQGIAAGYGIEVRKESQLTEVDGDSNRAVISDTKAGTKETVDYDILHATPPQSAPDWVKATPLADPASPFGYVQVDKHTLQSLDWPNVFALGDASNLPTSKTGAAIRATGPVSWPPTCSRRCAASGSQAPLQRLHLLSAGHFAQQDAARRVRLRPQAHADSPVHQHPQAAL